MPSICSVSFGHPTARFAYDLALPAKALESPRGRHAYAVDAFCGAVRATGDLLGATALWLTGTPAASLCNSDISTLRARAAHRIGAFVGCGAGCLIGTAVGVAAFLYPVDGAYEAAERSVLRAAHDRATRDLGALEVPAGFASIEAAWLDDMSLCMDVASDHAASRTLRLKALNHYVKERAQYYAEDTPHDDTALGRAAVRLLLIERALEALPRTGSSEERMVRGTLCRLQRRYAAAARGAAVVGCRHVKSGDAYHSDSPTLLRIKCAWLALSAPVLTSANVLVTMAVTGTRAWRAAYVEGDMHEALDQGLQCALAPLLGVGLQLTALGGVLAPNLGRRLYARLEAPLALTIAPCFAPTGRSGPPSLARPGMGRPLPPARHGLGGIPVLGGHV